MGIVSRAMQRADRQASLMSRMLNRLGLTIPEAAQFELGIPMRSACRNCMLCRHAAACEAWLSVFPHSCVTKTPDFCPNAQLFDRLRRRSAGPSQSDGGEGAAVDSAESPAWPGA
jgi:hypothetical protein